MSFGKYAIVINEPFGRLVRGGTSLCHKVEVLEVYMYVSDYICQMCGLCGSCGLIWMRTGIDLMQNNVFAETFLLLNQDAVVWILLQESVL